MAMDGQDGEGSDAEHSSWSEDETIDTHDENFTVLSLGSSDIQKVVPNLAVPSEKNIQKLADQVIALLAQGKPENEMLHRTTRRTNVLDSEALTTQVLETVRARLHRA